MQLEVEKFMRNPKLLVGDTAKSYIPLMLGMGCLYVLFQHTFSVGTVVIRAVSWVIASVLHFLIYWRFKKFLMEDFATFLKEKRAIIREKLLKEVIEKINEKYPFLEEKSVEVAVSGILLGEHGKEGSGISTPITKPERFAREFISLATNLPFLVLTTFYNLFAAMSYSHFIRKVKEYKKVTVQEMSDELDTDFFFFGILFLPFPATAFSAMVIGLEFLFNHFIL